MNQDNGQVSDDQELAKVLAGVTQSDDGLSFEETGKSKPAVVLPQADSSAQAPVVLPEPSTMPMPPATPLPTAPTPTPATPAAPAPVADTSLDNIKLAALSELRPLVDHLNVPPEEKFDTYLLLLRSTDDKSLIAPALEAARAITNEPRKAQALLDVVKEIDFLSQN